MRHLLSATHRFRRLPEKADEIALSSLVLDALGVAYLYEDLNKDLNKNLIKITLTIAVDNADGKEEQITRAFTLCGWWQGDVSDYSQYAWVSEAFAAEVAPKVTREALEGGAI